MKKAVIFDVQRYSVHDGPGIRTVVFFKGCPLRCRWCQNPESLHRSSEIGFVPERCIGCRNCEESCPEEAILSGTKRIERARCTVCGACVDTCYAEALRTVGDEWESDALLDEVLRDRAFHEDSGGGVTLSGGEPLLQIDFVEEFCSACRGESVPVAVETCGAVPWTAFEKVLPHVDSFYFDLKAAGDGLHQELVGASAERIFSNAQRLVESASITTSSP